MLGSPTAQSKSHGKTIAIDFDGVLHTYHNRKWADGRPGDDPVPGAADFIRWLRSKGWTPVIHSTRARTAEGVMEIRKWMAKHKFPGVKKITNLKVGAEIYIDDRGWRFSGDWEVLKEMLTLFDGSPPVWYEKAEK
jgi:hypothetical protein